jgi:hypothetical protein
MRIGIGIGIGFQGFLGAAGPTLQALEITWDNISNVPVADASSVDDWNTFFDLPTNGTPFTSVEVIGNLVKLYGGSGITVAGNLFDTNTNLISINDNIESIITAGEESFFNCTSATSFNFPNLTAAGSGCFAICTSATEFFLPLCANMGTDPTDVTVFNEITGNTITLTIPASLMTANGGNPHASIQYLLDNNTVTVITV